MGNSDLCITFNGEIAFIILGTRYVAQTQAINIALTEYFSCINNVREVAEFPEEITDSIRKIEIVEIKGGNQ